MRKVLCFDIDNVICKTKNTNYQNSIPIKKNIQTINKFKKKGFIIKLFTSRYMGRNKENKIQAKKEGYNFTKKQLKSWGLNYNVLIFGKPTFDLYIDDKNFEYDKNWSVKLLKKFKLK